MLEGESTGTAMEAALTLAAAPAAAAAATAAAGGVIVIEPWRLTRTLERARAAGGGDDVVGFGAGGGGGASAVATYSASTDAARGAAFSATFDAARGALRPLRRSFKCMPMLRCRAPCRESTSRDDATETRLLACAFLATFPLLLLDTVAPAAADAVVKVEFVRPLRRSVVARSGE